VVARKVIAHVGDPETVPYPQDWEDYPDLTEDQWQAVLARIKQIITALTPSEDEFVAAYEHLTGTTP
jgi:hypothetical protein